MQLIQAVMRVMKYILVGLTVVITVAAVLWFTLPHTKTEFTEPEPLTLPLLDTTRIELPNTYFGYVVDSFDHSEISKAQRVSNQYPT